MRTLLRPAVMAALLVLLAGTASAATYTLRAGTTVVDYGGGPVTMWGYALVSTDVPGVTAPTPVMIPGPTIYVPAGESLTINLTNELPGFTSIVIPGLPGPGTPVMVDGSDRVRSFTSEVGPYTWAAPRPGTYLYHSGTEVGTQVHMGLYGAVVVDAAADTTCTDAVQLTAYPGVCYDSDAVILFSEVDPALHNPVTRATPRRFKPKYFLVNGGSGGLTALTGFEPGQRVLLRFVNAGLNTYVPNLLGEYLQWVAEDGNLYPYAHDSYSGLLPAGKTLDALWTPDMAGSYKVIDRRLFMSANGVPTGGLQATLVVADPPGTPPRPTAQAGGPYTVAGPFPSSVVLSSAGSAGLNPGGSALASYRWTLVQAPAGSTADFVGATTPGVVEGASFASPTLGNIDVEGNYVVQLEVYDDRVQNGNPPVGNWSLPDLAVVRTNRRPLAIISAPATANVGSTVTLDGSASYDPEGPGLNPPNGIASYAWTVTDPLSTSQALAGVTPTFMATQEGTYTVELVVSDGFLDSDPAVAIVEVSVGVNQPPVANPDYGVAKWCHNLNQNQTYPTDCPAQSFVDIYVLANDTDNDGVHDIDPSTVEIITSPTQGGLATVFSDGTKAGTYVEYTVPYNWRGTDYFSYQVCDTSRDPVTNEPDMCSIAAVLVNVVNNP